MQPRADGYAASTVATIGSCCGCCSPTPPANDSSPRTRYSDHAAVAANASATAPPKAPGRPTGRPSRSPTTPHAYLGPTGDTTRYPGTVPAIGALTQSEPVAPRTPRC
ncbi:hypothetical protein GCM10009772_23300 [Pseudonocardia alni subsp. carboxydivorans]